MVEVRAYADNPFRPWAKVNHILIDGHCTTNGMCCHVCHPRVDDSETYRLTWLAADPGHVHYSFRTIAESIDWVELEQDIDPDSHRPRKGRWWDVHSDRNHALLEEPPCLTVASPTPRSLPTADESPHLTSRMPRAPDAQR